jgi:hypothetical protein
MSCIRSDFRIRPKNMLCPLISQITLYVGAVCKYFVSAKVVAAVLYLLLAGGYRFPP